ncbi:MAG: hypothetical protein K2N05_01725 [Muribaculaceae bacterium]|nr:hypothetical protein [Muribaculaceae bacterium]
MTAVEKRRLGEGVYGKGYFDYVYADSRSRYENAFGSSRPIRYGDRLLARVIMGGRTMVEFFINEVSDLTELIGELRKKTKGLRGLAQLYVRNYSRGWSMEKPFMIYNGTANRRSTSTPAYAVATPPSSGKRMLCPWETH